MRVLVVEDDERLATSLERGLRSEGFEVDREADGAVGLWRASEVAYDVIVLDLLLPGMNGFKVCAELRSRGVRTPVLVLTAKDGEFDEVEALDTGADDYLRKPFSFPVLVSRLHALARRPGPGRGAGAIRCGDLSVDPESNRCWRGSVEIRLTPREGAVLSLLARRAGEPVGKADILHLVWGDDVDDPNVVAVYVGYCGARSTRRSGRRRSRRSAVSATGYGPDGCARCAPRVEVGARVGRSTARGCRRPPTPRGRPPRPRPPG